MSNRRRLPPSTEFGVYLYGLMDAAGLNAADLARLSGAPESSISRWLSGGSLPTLDALRKVAPLLNVRVGDMLVKAGLATAAELGMVGAPPVARPLPGPVKRIIEIVEDKRISDHDTDVLLDAVDAQITSWLRTFRGLHATAARRARVS